MKLRGSHVALGTAALALMLGFSQVSTAMVFKPPAATPAAEAEPADGPVDQERLAAGLAAYKAAGCRACHGWAADGHKEGPNSPGPSLRATSLDFAGLREAIACGRPGTGMPFFWRDAYRRNSTDCFGVTAADLGDQLPPKANTRLTTQKVDDLAYYIVNYLKGRGEITLEECEFFYGVGEKHCADLPAAQPGG